MTDPNHNCLTRIKQYLKFKEIEYDTNNLRNYFTLQSDGYRNYSIGYWNENLLGPKPSWEEINNIFYSSNYIETGYSEYFIGITGAFYPDTNVLINYKVNGDYLIIRLPFFFVDFGDNMGIIQTVQSIPYPPLIETTFSANGTLDNFKTIVSISISTNGIISVYSDQNKNNFTGLSGIDSTSYIYKYK